jgi:SAM-dependent methyltransferase
VIEPPDETSDLSSQLEGSAVGAARRRAAALLRAARRRFGPRRIRRFWRLYIIKSHLGIELLRNWRIDRRFGGSCAGSAPSRFLERGAYGTSSADYWQLRRIFSEENGLAVEPDDILVDVGCGKGRVLNYWLELGHGNRLIGIELDPEIAAAARTRLAHWQNVEVLTGDGIELLPRDATIIFLFNPFGAAVLTRLRDLIAERYPPGGRLRIVYHFSMHRHVFEDDPRFDVQPLARAAFHPGVVVKLAG